MVAFVPIRSLPLQCGIATTDRATPGCTGVRAVREPARGPRAITTIISGYKWISNGPCEWWSLPHKEDKTTASGSRGITWRTVKMARILPSIKKTATERLFSLIEFKQVWGPLKCQMIRIPRILILMQSLTWHAFNIHDIFSVFHWQQRPKHSGAT